MSAYSIVVVDEAELAIVRAALGRHVEARKVPERKVAAAVDRERTELVIATGNDRLDAFMRRSRERRGVPAPRVLRTSTLNFPFGLKRLNAAGLKQVKAWDEAAIEAWRRRGVEVEQ